MPEGAVYVGRPTRFGNPYSTGDWPKWLRSPDSQVDAYRSAIIDILRPPSGALTMARLQDDFGERLPTPEQIMALRGKDLVCWCKECDPCHADVLLELANK